MPHCCWAYRQGVSDTELTATKVEQLRQQYPRGTCPIRYFKPAQACTGADGELGLERGDFCIVFQVRFQHGDTLMHEVALLMYCV